ncbi:membrane protein [Burkholderiaceae bacterium 16]|nr:membrane protein [Burkholderiaceae bacterium 16]
MSNSRFASHMRLWLVVTPVLLATLAPVLPDDRHFEIDAAEQASVESVFGADQAEALAMRANERFRAWFVDSGAMGRSYAGSANQTLVSDGGAAGIASSWIRHLWMELYRAIYRAAVAGNWVWGTLFFMAAMLNDGAVQRRIRAAAAGVASPVGFHLAAHGLLVAFGVSGSALLLPMSLPAVVWTGAAACIGALAWRLTASFHSNR